VSVAALGGCSILAGVDGLSERSGGGSQDATTGDGAVDVPESGALDAGPLRVDGSVDAGPDGGADAGDAAAVVLNHCAPGGDGLTNCGGGAESCCTTLLVTGGTFSRSYDGVTSGLTDPQYVATVADFRLDKYEITVGRFRKFVDAVVGGWAPAASSGKHTHVNGGNGLAASGGGYEPGWDPFWSPYVPTTKAGWDSADSLGCYPGNQTWTPAPGANEKLPISCANWYQAAAFCIWDGGFLPSEAEWNYAASGGSEQRVYPWGAAVPGADATLAVYGCYFNGMGTCVGAPNVAPVGSVSAGNGKYGQSDLAGNVFEWLLDGYTEPYNQISCTNCVYLTTLAQRMIRGGAFNNGAMFLTAGRRQDTQPTSRLYNLGARCARTP
jgi:formylglycine-generating enzyme required for sulfatase activity